MSRAYTVKEMDALRRVIETKFLWGGYNFPSNGRTSRSYQAGEKETFVEERLRTHMLAGHTAEDLLASEGPK